MANIAKIIFYSYNTIIENLNLTSIICDNIDGER